jgi:YidC/Oxa1 family membrane protein insertase
LPNGAYGRGVVAAPLAEKTFTMLDFVYYPVSAVLWAWHNVLATALGPASVLSWVLAVVLLVITLRAVLVVPFLKQARFQQIMLRLQPQIAAIQKRYPNDRRRQSVEIQKLQQEHGVNLLLGCLPMLAQSLVFIGLFHVLRSFDRTGSTMHLPLLGGATPMGAEQNAHTPNYVFNAEQVQSFLNARFFGAPLAASIHITGGHIVAVAAVAVPLMIVAAVATHFTARASVARQLNTANNATLLRVLSLWIFPIGALLGGPVLPVAILIYWVTNNAWTLAQQHIVYRMLDRETAQTAERTRQRRTANAPPPGRKPSRRGDR